MRTFWSNVAAVAYKEASVVRHDKALMATIVAQPIMMLLLFGVALSQKPANVEWLVVDHSHTASSRRLIQEITHTGYFLEPEPVSGRREGEALLARGDALALVIVPASFRRDAERGEPRVQLLLDGSDPLAAARVGAIVTQVAAAFDAGGPHGAEARRAGGRAAVELRQQFWFNPTLNDHWFFLAAMAGMLLTNLCLSATSLGLVGERENGTYEQMLSLPTRPLELVLGKIAPFVGLSYALMLASVLAAAVFFGVWPRGSWLVLSLVTLPFVLASLSIGVFVSTLARTSAQAVFITVFFILPSFVLSGSMLPYQLMPSGIRELGGLLPLRWYQIALRRIIERGGGLLEVLVPMAALLILLGVLLGLIRWRMRPRLA